jgi:hypothetical protein
VERGRARSSGREGQALDQPRGALKVALPANSAHRVVRKAYVNGQCSWMGGLRLVSEGGGVSLFTPRVWLLGGLSARGYRPVRLVVL